MRGKRRRNGFESLWPYSALATMLPCHFTRVDVTGRKNLSATRPGATSQDIRAATRTTTTRSTGSSRAHPPRHGGRRSGDRLAAERRTYSSAQ